MNQVHQERNYLNPLLLFLFLFGALITNAQQEVKKPVRHPVRNIAWFTPSNATQVNGLAVGLQNMNFREHKVTVNGINAEAGAITAFLLPYALVDALSDKKQILSFQHPDSTEAYVNGITVSFGGNAGTSVNGLCISGAVSQLGGMNGIVVTGLFSRVYRFRGINVSGFMNKAKEGRGLQIGLFNKCENLKGVQLGLWNRVGKKGFPFINMRF